MREKKKLYPLSVAQKMHFFTLKYCPKKQVLNIGTSMTILDDIDFTLLKEAIYRAYDRCESMRLRFTKETKGEVFQYVVPKEERDIEFFDFSGWTMEDAEEEMGKWTELPFERVDSPMFRMVMIVMPDGYKGIYFNVDHIIMDSYAIIVFISDIIELYCNLKYDTEYPKPMQSYIKALEKDLTYEANKKAIEKDSKYWNQVYNVSEPIFADIMGMEKLEEQRKATNNPNLRAAKFVFEDVSAKHRMFHLEPEPTKRLINFCEEVKLPMVCLLMMGLRTYLSKMNQNEEDISIKSTVSRRATILDKKSGGTRIHFFPCRTTVKEDESFLDGMKKVQARQNEIFKHANYNPITLLTECKEAYQNEAGAGYECMSLTYQPMSLRSDDDRIKGVKYKCKWYSNGVAACPLYLTVMHNSVDEGLDFYFEYQTGAVTDDQLEYLYYYLCKILFMGIDNPNSSVGEILRTV